MKEGNLASTGKKQNTRDYKIYKFVHSMRKAQGKKKKSSPEWAESGSKGSLQRPEEQREIKIMAFWLRFTLSYRHYSEKNFEKEDVNWSHK